MRLFSNLLILAHTIMVELRLHQELNILDHIKKNILNFRDSKFFLAPVNFFITFVLQGNCYVGSHNCTRNSIPVVEYNEMFIVSIEQPSKRRKFRICYILKFIYYFVLYSVGWNRLMKTIGFADLHRFVEDMHAWKRQIIKKEEILLKFGINKLTILGYAMGEDDDRRGEGGARRRSARNHTRARSAREPSATRSYSHHNSYW